MTIDSMTKFYAFIGQKIRDCIDPNIEDDDGWKGFMKRYDTDENGCISKDEMKALISSEQYNEQLFNQFWKGLDTVTKKKTGNTKNKNNLIGGELAKLELLSEKALIAQNYLDEYDSDDIPSQISSVISIEKIKTLVMNSLNINALATMTEEDVEDHIDDLFDQCCIDAFLDEIYPKINAEFKDQFPEGYNIDGDNELWTLISNYVSHTDAGIDAILDDIDKIIRNYLAQAGIGNAPEDMTGLEDYTGPTSTATKDFSALQQAQLEAKFTNALNINNLLSFSIPDQYKTQLESLIEDFIKGVLNGDLASGEYSYRTFAYIMSKDDAWVVQKFKATEDYQKLATTFKFFNYENIDGQGAGININDHYVSIGMMFKSWFGVSTLPSDEQAECIRYMMESTTYQNIVAAAYKKYQSGEITSEADLFTEIGKQVMMNLAQIMSEVGQKCEIVEQMLYNSLEVAQKGLTYWSGDVQPLGIEFTTDELRTLYNQYIGVLKSWKSQLSDSDQQAKLQKIISELESDSYPGRFLQNIQTAHGMIAKLNLESELPFESTYSVNAIDYQYINTNVTKGMSDQEIGTLGVTWNDPQPNPSTVEYDVECNKSGITVKITESGKVKVTVLDSVEAEFATVNFDIKVNGEVVHSGTFDLQIEELSMASEDILESGFNEDLVNALNSLEHVHSDEGDASTLCSGDHIVWSASGLGISDTNPTGVYQKIQKMGAKMKDKAINKGINEQVALNAYKTFMSYYKGALLALVDYDFDSRDTANEGYLSGESFSYTQYGPNGTTTDVTSSDKSHTKCKNYEDRVNSWDKLNNMPSDTGLHIGTDSDSQNNGSYNFKRWIYLDHNVAADKFIQFLQAAMGAI